MKTIVVLASLLSLLPIVGMTAPQQEAKAKPEARTSDGVTLVLKAVAPSVIQGQTIALLVTVKNNGRKDLFFPDTNPLCDFDLDVKSPRGISVPLNAMGRQLRSSEDTQRRIKRKLVPGQHFQTVLLASLIYDFQEIGTYTVTATRDFSRFQSGALGEQFPVVTSNSIYVTVRRKK